MRKAYLLIYNSAAATRGQVNAFLDACEGVITWRFDIDNRYYVISELDATDIYRSFRGTFPRGRVFITEISSSNRQGWITERSWGLIKKKGLE